MKSKEQVTSIMANTEYPCHIRLAVDLHVGAQRAAIVIYGSEGSSNVDVQVRSQAPVEVLLSLRYASIGENARFWKLVS